MTFSFASSKLVLFHVANFGEGFTEHGSVSDGKFEIVNLKKLDLDALLKAGLTKFNFFVEADRYKEEISCRNAHITLEEAAPFQVDGEYIGELKELDIKILPGAVTMLV